MPARYLGAFGSRVARRVFVLFLICALVPTGVVGVFAWRRSSSELERAAREQLHRDSRSEGMALVSRLLVADGLLRALGDGSPRFLPGTRPEAMPWHAVRRTRSEELPGGPLAAPEQKAIQAGKSVLRRVAEERVLLVRAPDPAGSDRLLAAELAAAYLWTYDRNDPDSGLTIVDDAGQLVFSSLSEDAARGIAEAIVPGLRREGPPQPEAQALIAEPWLLFLGSHFAAPTWYVVRSQSRDLTFAPLAEFQAVFRWSLLLAILVVTALSSIQIRRTLRPIQLLSQAALRLGEGRFATRAAIATRDEFGELGEAFDGMATRIERHAQALASASAVGVALSHERSEERLIALVLQALVDTTNSQSSAFLRLNAGGGLDVAATRGSWRGESIAADEAARTGEIAIRPAAPGVEASLALPLFDHEERFVALLEVAGPRDEGGEPIPSYRESEVAAARSLASQAAVAFNNRSLVDEFRVLFEGLIGLTVTALDEKSAYTGGHCRRVPILAEMLADAVCRTREGVFARFEFSAAERYELRIAALLHDFGKVVTPVHVMDKSTKLETIHDRIELVAVRYAVLQREAEIAWLRAKLAAAGGGEAGDPPALAELEEELAFLRACNVGGEEMDPAQRDRVRAIAARRRWRDAHGVVAPVLDDDEVENLSIPRGTLNPRERKVVEDHASLTIRLLEQLPFPPHLGGVPHIAGSHHERIDGLGYPLGLTGNQITLQGRLLGLADVFEALTAPDRPYRDPMTVSEAVELVRGLVKEGHLDADLFEVFIRERVHLRYAMDQLRADQLDEAVFADLAELTGNPLPGR